MSSHYAALLEACCCDPPEEGCTYPCNYIAVDGAWVFIPNSPDPECGGECHCLAPDIAVECEGQLAGCICMGNSQSDSGSDPNCGYTVCGSESFPS